MRTLRVATAVETISLTVLLLNLATAHIKAISSLVGPLHGAAYLTVVAATLALPSAAATGARWRSAVPVVGGLLALRRLRKAGA